MTAKSITPATAESRGDDLLPNGVPLKKATFADFRDAIDHYDSQAAARERPEPNSGTDTAND